MLEYTLVLVSVAVPDKWSPPPCQPKKQERVTFQVQGQFKGMMEEISRQAQKVSAPQKPD